MTTNTLPATPNRTEQARTAMTDQSLPTPTKPNHANRTMCGKTRCFHFPTAGEKFPSNHQSAAKTTPHPNIDPPTNAAGRHRTRANPAEQLRTALAFQDLPTPTKLNHPNRTISSNTRRVLRDTAQEKFLFNHLPPAKHPLTRTPRPPTTRANPFEAVA